MAKTSVKTAQAAPRSQSREPQIPAMTLRVTEATIHNKNAPGESCQGNRTGGTKAKVLSGKLIDNKQAVDMTMLTLPRVRGPIRLAVILSTAIILRPFVVDRHVTPVTGGWRDIPISRENSSWSFKERFQ